MSEVVLSLQGLQTYYGKIHALRGITISVKQGQIVTLLGSNGAGKSTTLKTISGIVHASSGKVEFMGKDITTLAPHTIVEMGVIHVPEGRHIFKDLTVKENLELGSFTLKDEKERKRRLDRAFDRFPRLRERWKQMGGTLSGGEQQMLAIGRALMTEPKVLLLDEPSMGLAPVIVQEIGRIIKQLNEEGTTILLVEQNAKMALKLAHYGYVMDTGSIVMQDDSAKLRENESIVKAYLGG
ncbi:ABC transporter ATP-binding protein [Candidatus Formimonas warabiya]|uniref:ABC transporter ATP-binding protein n=1 Tax=Formimonas warabiya TaxID=1761012 RepID=A0A3G1KTT8_FORW1|nr:ABC transporter ATP-binding protein [Candidatus Formimonas warabiya]ATW25923.1 ABC transporter ATP-binding protein [Candidatus Formimonas warabiya]